MCFRFFMLNKSPSEFLKIQTWDWRENSALKSTSFSFRGPDFNFHHPQDSSQTIYNSCFTMGIAHLQYTDKNIDKTLIHIKNISK